MIDTLKESFATILTLISVIFIFIFLQRGKKLEQIKLEKKIDVEKNKLKKIQEQADKAVINVYLQDDEYKEAVDDISKMISDVFPNKMPVKTFKAHAWKTFIRSCAKFLKT